VQAKYPSTAAALATIDQELRGFYKTQSGHSDSEALARADAVP
jgi:hypothetical protein